MKNQKTYNQVIAENATLRENNAWLLLACKTNGAIIRILEKKLHIERERVRR